MKLSVIIVNYNVKFFLEQCLHSVEKAIRNVPAEIFVVDNNSADGSVNMIKQKFPSVKLIENDENKGFSYGNNQAIRISSGEYILILNPDTVVEENTFEKCISFMDEHPDAGALGVRMIDGKGYFLPESKRSLPTPEVAFYKMFGISGLFPKSKRFGRYHLGFLDEKQIHKIDILPGAFMFIRHETLKKTGLLDEDFFMYGEDIDLSYRIIKAGYNNYYFPETTIIHYKGESTKKGSINYVRMFYNAMIIFANKHFSRKKANIFAFLINIAIYFRAILAILNRIFNSILLPLTDAIFIYLGFYFIKPIWEHYKFGFDAMYPSELLTLAVPAYLLVWLISIYFSGGYDKPVRIFNLLKGIGTGTIIILLIYSLLPDYMRFSRALIILGTGWSLVVTTLFRLLLHTIGKTSFTLAQNRKKKIIIVGNESECRRIESLLSKSDIKYLIAGFVSSEKNSFSQDYIGSIEQIKEIIRVNKIDEIIFSGKDITSEIIIKNMLELSDINVDYKIAPPESLSIIGSNSIHTAGDLYVVNINSIAKHSNQRYKRLLDISSSLVLFICSPLLIFIYKKPGSFLHNLFRVLIGMHSWIGYHPVSYQVGSELPKIKPGILYSTDLLKIENLDEKSIEKINLVYAKDYRLFNDFEIIIKNFRKLDRD